MWAAPDKGEDGGKVELVGGKVVWCHPFNAPGQADGCFLLMGLH